MTDIINEDLARIDADFLILIDHIFHDEKPVKDRVAMVEQVYRPFMALIQGLGYTRTEILMEACSRYIQGVGR